MASSHRCNQFLKEGFCGNILNGVFNPKGVIWSTTYGHTVTLGRPAQIWSFPSDSLKNLTFRLNISLLSVLGKRVLKIHQASVKSSVCLQGVWNSFWRRNWPQGWGCSCPSAFPDVEPSVSVNFSRFTPSAGLAGLIALNTQGDGAEAAAIVRVKRLGLGLPQNLALMLRSQLPRGKALLATVLVVLEHARSPKKCRGKETR